MESESYQNCLGKKTIVVCEEFLRGEIGVIAASRHLVSLFAHMNMDDSDFILFKAIESQTDHLPIGEERKNWNTEALKRKDIEISEYELTFKNEMIETCQKVISKLKDKS